MQRNFNPERIRRFHIEHELELCRAHDRKVRWALALEHAASDAAELLVAVDEAGTVADETARDGKFADVIDRRNAMAPSEPDDRVALTVKKGIALDDERASSLIAKRLEGPREVGRAPRLQHDETPPKRLRRGADLLRMALGARVIGVDEERNEVRARHHLAHHVETLTSESARDQADPGRVALGVVEACDEPSAYRILSDHEDDWGRARGGLRGRGGRVPAGDEYRYGKASQLGRECAEALIAPASPAIFDVEVTLLDISGALEAAQEGGPVIGGLLLRARGEKAHHRSPAGLLRRGRERPRDCRAQSRRKLPPP